MEPQAFNSHLKESGVTCLELKSSLHQGFGASNFNMVESNFWEVTWKLSLEFFWDAHDVLHQSALFDNPSFYVG